MKPINENLIISDFDNTIINFKKIDNEIITRIFNLHGVVLILDKFLWKINDVGFFGNSMRGLKLRFLAYSLITKLSLHPLKYKDIFSEYSQKYKKYAFEEYQIKRNLEQMFLIKGYKFIILTNNKLTLDIGIDNIVYSKSKRRYLRNNIPKYLIGDNFWDDYRNCPKNTQYINIGKGGFVRAFCKNSICINTINEIKKNI